MFFLFLFGLALGAVSPSHEYEVKLHNGNCSTPWLSFNNNCYRYISNNTTWADAEFQCVSQGANLVSIHSVEEDNFVQTLIKTFDPAEGHTWIGLTDAQTEGMWFWSDGSKVDFTNWAKGQPDNIVNENCGHFNHGASNYWNDRPCSQKFPFVCKARTVCP